MDMYVEFNRLGHVSFHEPSSHAGGHEVISVISRTLRGRSPGDLPWPLCHDAAQLNKNKCMHDTRLPITLLQATYKGIVDVCGSHFAFPLPHTM